LGITEYIPIIFFFVGILLSCTIFRWRVSEGLIFTLVDTALSLLLLSPLISIPTIGVFFFHVTLLQPEHTLGYLFFPSEVWRVFSRSLGSDSWLLFKFTGILFFVVSIGMIIGTIVTCRVLRISFRRGLIFCSSVWLSILLELIILGFWGALG